MYIFVFFSNFVCFQVLVLSPTREIAAQAEATMAALGGHLSVQVHW
jgi:superfamily II DNA/RNA helicase